MSGDQLVTSFVVGDQDLDPETLPPTPRQTPTSAALLSPCVETPNNSHNPRFDDLSRTPRFAEEYSVFNTTPGNLKISQGTFTAACTPITIITACPRTPTPSIVLKRPLSAGDIAAEVASHVNYFCADSEPPPVEPSLRLPSSPLPLINTSRVCSPEPATPHTHTGSQGRPRKRARKGTTEKETPPVQTATPPPSARKAARTPAPASMQNDQGYGQQDFLGGGPQHLDMTAFTASQHDVFGYPMSAPASASASFWDPNMSLSGMDLDFASQAAASGILFQTPASSQQQPDSYDWTSNTALFQNNGAHDGPAATPAAERPQSSNQENIRPAPKKERRLAPKPSTSDSQNVPVTSTSSTASETYTVAPEAPFTLSPGGGVNPGLLFSRPSSSSMGTNTNAFGLVSQPETSPRLLADAAPVAPSTAGPSGVQRSFSHREPGSRGGREIVSSPIKPSASRPGVQRSFSDNRGRRKQPPLAPLSRPHTTPATQASRSGVGSNRPPSSRQGGRLSPSKLHHRLSSLSAIPETSGPRTRTSVKFTIDSHGRAHAETTVVLEEPSPSVYRRTSRDSSRHGYLVVSDSEESETDDEPILIPSRNASFALPDPHKPVGSIFGNSSKKKSAKGSGSLTFDSRPGSRGDDDDQSEAETVLEEGTGQAGDAASELRKVVEDRDNKRAAARQRSQQRQFNSGAFTWAGGNLLSPTADASIPTPSTGSRSHMQRVRCICHSNDHSSSVDVFMVQCHSCELWLHGRCINITRRDMPPVYICAFCANTPNMRGGRVRDSGRHGAPSSPLAHKSFKAFR